LHPPGTEGIQRPQRPDGDTVRQKEFNDRNVPTATLYGRVLEFVDMSEQELQEILQRLSNYNQLQ